MISMSYKLKALFPSDTNHSMAVAGLGVLNSNFSDNQSFLIFENELSLDESSLITSLGGVLEKC